MEKTNPKSLLPTIARVVLGLIFLVLGLNGFLNFLPQPESLPENVVAFNMAIMETGYLFQFVLGFQILVGLMLLLNFFVPLALVMIAPFIINILAYHIFFFPSGILPGVVVFLLESYLVWNYRDLYRPMLAMRT